MATIPTDRSRDRRKRHVFAVVVAAFFGGWQLVIGGGGYSGTGIFWQRAGAGRSRTPVPLVNFPIKNLGRTWRCRGVARHFWQQWSWIPGPVAPADLAIAETRSSPRCRWKKSVLERVMAVISVDFCGLQILRIQSDFGEWQILRRPGTSPLAVWPIAQYRLWRQRAMVVWLTVWWVWMIRPCKRSVL